MGFPNFNFSMNVTEGRIVSERIQPLQSFMAPSSVTLSKDPSFPSEDLRWIVNYAETSVKDSVYLLVFRDREFNVPWIGSFEIVQTVDGLHLIRGVNVVLKMVHRSLTFEKRAD